MEHAYIGQLQYLPLMHTNYQSCLDKGHHGGWCPQSYKGTILWFFASKCKIWLNPMIKQESFIG
jgi:hypothetical protein